jgi:hypothetical protein
LLEATVNLNYFVGAPEELRSAQNGVKITREVMKPC